jgi:Transglycosylase
VTPRRIALWGGLVLLALLPLAVPLGGGWLVRAKVLPRLERRIGRRVSVSSVHVGFGKLALRGLTVDGAGAAPPVVIPLVRARYSLAALLGGRVVVEDVLLDHPRFEIVRGGGAEDNVTSILETLRAPHEGGGGGASRVQIARLRVEKGAAAVSVVGMGDAQVATFDADLTPDGAGSVTLSGAELRVGAGPRLGAKTLQLGFTLAHWRPVGVPTMLVEGGVATPFRGLALSDIAGSLGPDPAEPERAVLAVHGSYGGAGAQLWNATGWFRESTEEGVFKLQADRFRLSQLDSILAGGPVQDTAKAEVDAHLDVVYRAGVVGFSGAAHFNGLTIAHPMLAPVPVPRLGLEGRAHGTLDVHARRLTLKEASVDFRNLHATLVADVENVGRKPRFTARLMVKPLPCQLALASLPAEVTPNLQGFKLKGEFSTDLHLGLDFGDLDQPIDLGGQVGIEGCKVVEAPEMTSQDRLLGTFEQTVEVEPGKWMTFIVGPENPDWVTFNDISPYLINSIITTEDSGFFKHKGFIPSEFRSALQQNLQRGYFRLGASSITMQMVKNVLLSREKTLSRKLQELFLTWHVEHHLTKERIMEIYFNVIEFGPGIYGIGRAARHYFGKTPRELLPQEAAFFSSILPNPKKRYVQYCHKDGLLDAKWQNYINRILRRTHERGRLSDEDYEKAIAAPLRFDRAEAQPERDCMALVKRLTTPTMPVMDISAP